MLALALSRGIICCGGSIGAVVGLGGETGDGTGLIGCVCVKELDET